MRRWWAIAKATALEILSEPLSLLVLLAALTMAVVAPALHYHQFGEATRMARDSGFSALLIGGLVFVVFPTIRSFRREIESGTADMALAHAVSREGFFFFKTLGALIAHLVFAAILFFTAMMVIEGAAIGGRIAEEKGDIARIYGPFLAGGVAVIVLPLILGALQNRFARCRFVISAFVWALVLAIAGMGVVTAMNAALVVSHLPVAVLAIGFTEVMLTASAAFAIRFRANGAASAVGIVLAAAIPAIGNYYAVDAISGARSLPMAQVALALALLVPALMAFLWLGRMFAQGWRR